MLTIWGRRSSFNVQKVLWLAGELGLAYRHVSIGGEFGGCNTAEFEALNPTRRIPVIELDGEIAWESHTILRLLAAHTRQAPFWLADPFARSHAERWMDWCQTTLEPDLMTGLFWAMVRTPESERNWSLVQEKNARCTQHFQMLDRMLATRPFLSGDALGLGDIPVGATLFRYFSLDLERPALPHVGAWYRRLQQRPAYREHVMVSFEALRGRPG
ncbi:glutathione S-transferase family protein [Paraburkholderia bryophila]|jgi:glutathione S-transferase|uniref:Glutathione S-transferase n=1 Tax=Paraburkholderia bryophila TaxID=420952 RepID=A0A329CWG5_9BURK|nr:glutathione S-transferase [Paraburkholderia bryophila]RAS38748.1 glutathione S-transferase [Paraburkholderia bryophila]